MNAEAWTPAVVTAGIVLLYELWLAAVRRTRPGQLARAAHASLRDDWFAAVSAQPGSEILAVQTLREGDRGGAGATPDISEKEE